MRENRNNLRPVTVRESERTIIHGYFHCFGQEGSLEDGIVMYATIELEDGTIYQADPYQMKFDDVE